MLAKAKRLLTRIITWQKRPIAVAKNTSEETTCKNCGDTFVGNYCPRCGQSRNTPRIGSWSAIRIFLDTWGLGTHGLLRTIWNLFARPGYMIGDYIEGRRQLYFPPFKTLFVVGTIFAIVFTLSGGFSDEAIKARHIPLNLENRVEEASDDAPTTVAQDEREKARDARIDKQAKEDIALFEEYLKKYNEWRDRNRVMDQLAMHVIFALIAWRIFRKSPRHPRLNIAENVIAQVYICTQMGVVALAYMLIEIPFTPYPSGTIPGLASFLLFFYDYKQLYGFGIWHTLWKTLLMYLLFFLAVFVFLLLIVITIGFRAGVAAVG